MLLLLMIWRTIYIENQDINLLLIKNGYYAYYLLTLHRLTINLVLETDWENSIRNLTNKEKVDVFIVMVRIRQELEDLYYKSGDPKLLIEIEKSRIHIRGMLQKMGVKEIPEWSL